MVNSAVIMGRLTSDPELRTTSSGLSVTSFTVAVDRNYKKDETDFINVTAWRQTADFVTKFFRKGSMIAIQGHIETRNYEDKNGNKRTAVEIIADNVSFCGDKANKDNLPNPFKNGSDVAKNEDLSISVEEDSDGLPF